MVYAHFLFFELSFKKNYSRKIDRTIVRRFYDSVENYKVIAPSAPALIGRTVGDVMSSVRQNGRNC